MAVGAIAIISELRRPVLAIRSLISSHPPTPRSRPSGRGGARRRRPWSPRTRGGGPAPRPGRRRSGRRRSAISSEIRVDSSSARGRVEGQPQREQHVGQAHHAEPDRAPPPVGGLRLGDRVEAQVDRRGRGTHGGADGRTQPARSRTASPSGVRWAARLIEPRLQTAVSPSLVTSRISVQRFDRWMTFLRAGRLVAGRGWPRP